MIAPAARILAWLCLLPLLGPVVAHSAAIFDPDLTNATTMATQPVSHIGAPAASGYILNGSQQVFVIDYSSKNWTGDLHSYDLSPLGEVSPTDNWDGGAKTQIQNQNAGTGENRYIVTMNGASKIPFRWTDLSAAQKTALDPTTAGTTATTSPVLDYIRGSNVNEAPSGNVYRARAFVLGDIIHSTPRYWNDGTNTTVFVGANDGMLHAINAVDGTERFAYIPSMLISKLPNLKNVAYAHKYFVDGQLAARKFGSQSILVGGLGGGGKGLFGLDITAVPTSEPDAASKVLWEITNATSGYANLGHTYGTPQLAILPDGTNAMIIGNGYNNSGNGHSSLFLINPATGARIAEIDAGTGSASAPNGLSSPTVVDADFDGRVDYAYAGDIDGKLWKFDLAARTSSLLYTTSPLQAITMAPGYRAHPSGGYMITFATGRIFVAADETNNATHYAYGIWDRPAAYAANNALLAQTLTERIYTAVTPNIRVRTASNNQPNWNAGAGNHMGWRTPLPIAGERVVGDGGYVPDSVFLFMSTNPMVNPTSFPPFENWWMQLNALTGGDNGIVRFDLNSDNLFTPLDTVDVSGTEMSPTGRHMGGGVRSQLTEFSTPNFEVFLANYDVNTDPAVVVVTTHGVAGGHFDFDIYHGAVTSTGTQATATIVVSANGQTSPFPATLGAITLDGVVVVPALTVSDIPDGTATATNASKIKTKVTGGFTATLSGNTVTIKAPVGAAYNGKTLAIANGTSAPLVNEVIGVAPVAGVVGEAPAPGTLVITNANKDKDLEIKCGGIFTLPRVRSLKSDFVNERLDDLYTKINITASGYTTSCTKVVDSGTGKTTALSCAIQAPIGVSACSSFTLKEMSASTNVGPQGGVNPVTEVIGVTAVPQSGWTDFKPALTASAFTGGSDGTVAAMTCSSCKSIDHFHEYDDIYDRTGVNMLDPSYKTLNLANAIRSLSTPFKVLAQNQYLSPATKVHLNGTPPYVYNADQGYTRIQDFVTYTDIASPAVVVPPAVVMLDDAKLPTFTRTTLQSLAVNMPVHAFTIMDWWGGANIGNPPTPAPPDLRAGLHPTQTGCVNGSAGSTDGNMFEPVIPYGVGDAYSPALTVPVQGLLGYGTTSWAAPTTPATARGVRHNGALTIQVIKADTPYSAVEMSIPNHPEYGWRVKAASFSAYVLVEYTIFWHHPNKFCFGAAGWVKNPAADTSASSTSSSADLAAAAAASDPKVGALGAGGAGVLPGTWTTTVTNPDGTTTTTTVTIVVNEDGSATTTTTTSISTGESTTTTTNTNYTGGPVDTSGIIGGGVTTPADAVGRVNWRELVR